MIDSESREPVLGLDWPEPSRRRRRILLASSFFLLAAVGSILGVRVHLGRVAGRALAEAVARLDRSEPGWRSNEIQAVREAVGHPRDGAKEVLATARSLPGSWPGRRAASALGGDAWEPIAREIRAHDPGEPLPAAQAGALRAEAESLLPAIARASGLESSSSGRYRVAWAVDLREADRTHLTEAGRVAELLWLDAIDRSEEGEVGEAVAACSALINVARSIGDEPQLDSQRARSRIALLATHALQRSLSSRGQLSEKSPLESLGVAFADEAAHPYLVIALRGERARQFDLFGRLATGLGDLKTGASAGGLTTLLRRSYVGPLYEYNAALALEAMTEALGLLEGTSARRREALTAWDDRVRSERVSSRFGRAAYLVLPPLTGVAAEFDETRAILAAAANALAARRYQASRGGWPGSTAELVPEFLPAPILDPIDGRPIRIARFPGGIKLYSLGLDGRDDGGKVAPGSSDDVGFRLWDSPRRTSAGPVAISPGTK